MRAIPMLFLTLVAFSFGVPVMAQNCNAPEQMPAIECSSDSCYESHIGAHCWSWYQSGVPVGECWTKYSGCLGNATWIIHSYYGTPSNTECNRRGGLISPCPTGGCPDPDLGGGGGGCHEGQICGTVTVNPSAEKSSSVLKIAEGVELLRGTTLFMVGNKSAIVTAPNRKSALTPLIESQWIIDRLSRQYNGKAVDAMNATKSVAGKKFIAQTSGAVGLIYRANGRHLGFAAEVVQDQRFRTADSYLRAWPDPFVIGNLIGRPVSDRYKPVVVRLLTVYVYDGKTWSGDPSTVSEELADVFIPE